MNDKIDKKEQEILESEEFNRLLNAVDLIIRAESDITHLNKTINEMQLLSDNVHDTLSLEHQKILSDAFNSVKSAVDEMDSDLLKYI